MAWLFGTGPNFHIQHLSGLQTKREHQASDICLGKRPCSCCCQSRMSRLVWDHYLWNSISDWKVKSWSRLSTTVKDCNRQRPFLITSELNVDWDFTISAVFWFKQIIFLFHILLILISILMHLRLSLAEEPIIPPLLHIFHHCCSEQYLESQARCDSFLLSASFEPHTNFPLDLEVFVLEMYFTSWQDVSSI